MFWTRFSGLRMVPLYCEQPVDALEFDIVVRGTEPGNVLIDLPCTIANLR